MGRFAPDHPLVKFRQAVEAAFGDKVERVVLFGSRARGDARPDSDWDVAVFVKHGGASRPLRRALSDLAYPFVVNGVYIRPVALDTDRVVEDSELMADIRQDGVEIRPS